MGLPYASTDVDMRQGQLMNAGARPSLLVHFGHVVFNFSGPNRGHYIAIVKSHDFWLLFDDDIVEVSEFVCSHGLILT